MPIELISAIAGLILTLLVFSYLIGDNPLFRLATYLFIGTASGYAAAVICIEVLVPKLMSLSIGDPVQLLLGLAPFFLGTTLLAKLTPRISWVGNFAMAVLVGVGTATAVAGALSGTLIPQVSAAMNAFSANSTHNGTNPLFQFIEGGTMLVGTVLTLVYFQFGAKRTSDGTVKRNVLIEALAWLGGIFIAITLGLLFAGVYMAALTAMIERLSTIIQLLKSLSGL